MYVVLKNSNEHLALKGVDAVYTKEEYAIHHIKNRYEKQAKLYASNNLTIGWYELEYLNIVNLNQLKESENTMKELDTKMTKPRLIGDKKNIYGFSMDRMSQEEIDNFISFCGKACYKIIKPEYIIDD